MITVNDNFLTTYPELKDYSLTADYSGVKNPIDKVIYPHICAELPEAVKSEILTKLGDILKREPTNVTMFLRQSPEGVPVPHIAHHDLSMGRFSLMLYLNSEVGGGTAMLRHIETGMMYAPDSETFAAIARNDQNDTSKWAVVEKAPMLENRAAIFDAGFFHCALPIGGFGEGQTARTVLTAFFS